MTQRKIEYRIHAVQRMWQRGITPDEVAEILELGEVVEDYPDDQPYPSRLLIAWVKGRPLHLVVAENTDDGSAIVITVYQPDLLNWQQRLQGETQMKCVICKHGKTESGFATVALDAAGVTLVVKRVPANICGNCGEEYVSGDIASELFKTAVDAAKRGVELDVRHYLMAA